MVNNLFERYGDEPLEFKTTIKACSNNRNTTNRFRVGFLHIIHGAVLSQQICGLHCKSKTIY